MNCQMKFRTLSFFLLLLMLFSLTVSAIDFPSAGYDFYCTDLADVISESTAMHIMECGDRLYHATGAQIVIVTLDSLQGENIAQYAAGLASQWQIGSPDRCNGLLLVMSISDADYYIVQGSGLKYALSDESLAALLDTSLEPYFAAANYDTGARSIYDALFSELCRIYGYDGTSDIQNYRYVGETDGYAGQKSKSHPIIAVLLVILFLFIVFWILSAVSRSMYFSKKKVSPFWRPWYPLFRSVFWRGDAARRRRPVTAGRTGTTAPQQRMPQNRRQNPQRHRPEGYRRQMPGNTPTDRYKR